MANAVEITPVIRQASCDDTGVARLIFMVTNILDRDAEIQVGVAAGESVGSNWFEVQDGPSRTLVPRATARIVVLSHVPPGTALGTYKMRLEVSEARHASRVDRSPSVDLEVATEIKGDLPEQPKAKAKIGWFASLWARIRPILIWPFLALWRAIKWIIGKIRRSKPSAPAADPTATEGSAPAKPPREMTLKTILIPLAVVGVLYLMMVTTSALRAAPASPPKSELTRTLFYRIFISESSRSRPEYSGPTCVCDLF